MFISFDATTPERFSLDDHALELLRHRALSTRFVAARLLSQLIRCAKLNFGGEPIALDDHH